MASPLTVWSSTADGRVRGLNTAYATARSTGASALATGTSTTFAGQQLLSGNYYCYEGFFDFDTSSIGASSTPTVATFSVYGASDNSTVDFVAQARMYDWGGTLEEGDFRSGNPADTGSLDEYTLVASFDTSGWSVSGYNALASESAFLTNLAQTGTTYVVVNSDRQLSGTAPADGITEYVSCYFAEDATGAGGTDKDPKLYVEYTEGGSPASRGIRIQRKLRD